MIWIFRLMLILGIIYNGFAWYSEVQSEKKGSVLFKKVLFIDCNATKGSAIKIDNNGKYERVEVPRDYCKKISEGDKIKLIYNEAFKSHNFPKNRSSRNILIFFIILLIISFINLQKLKNKLSSNFR